MKGLRLTELYPSIQGEGPNMGAVTTFVRFGGCNFRCPGWPCDTQHAIQPSIWKNDPIVEPVALSHRIKNEMPGSNVCITGGEPTMQPEADLQQLASDLLLSGYTIDVFTNGSLVELPGWMHHPRVTVMMDWKLGGSGEANGGLGVRFDNAYNLSPKDGIKFVICTPQDFEDAYALYKSIPTTARFWAGAAWGKYKESKLVKQIMEHDLPWRMNVQVHKYIWPNIEKGI
jgi:7-carboxy-7-deazaguanine synthase